MAMRCFWPPDNWPPPAPTKVLYFSGKLSTKLNWASAQACLLVGWARRAMCGWCLDVSFPLRNQPKKTPFGKVHHDAETGRNHPAWVKSSLLASGKPCMMLWRMELAKSTGSWHVSTVAPEDGNCREGRGRDLKIRGTARFCREEWENFRENHRPTHRLSGACPVKTIHRFLEINWNLEVISTLKASMATESVPFLDECGFFLRDDFIHCKLIQINFWIVDFSLLHV